MYWPYVEFGCGLIINSAATAAYVAAHCALCGPDGIRGQWDMDCECDALFFDQDANPFAYTTPSGDGVDWYSAAIPESGRFLGYRVADVTRPNQTKRTITPRIGKVAGGVLGRLRREAIRFDFKVLLFACDELAMEHGFRFMSQRLACFNFATQCERTELIYRDTCQELGSTPTVAAVSGGRWIVTDVLLATGPVWSTDPLPGMRQHVRAVEFSIVGESTEPVAHPF